MVRIVTLQGVQRQTPYRSISSTTSTSTVGVLTLQLRVLTVGLKDTHSEPRIQKRPKREVYHNSRINLLNVMVHLLFTYLQYFEFWPSQSRSGFAKTPPDDHTSNAQRLKQTLEILHTPQLSWNIPSHLKCSKASVMTFPVPSYPHLPHLRFPPPPSASHDMFPIGKTVTRFSVFSSQRTY